MERLELSALEERNFMQKEAAEQIEDAQPVDHAVKETGAGGRGEIFGWDRHLFDAEAQMSRLDEHFLVEDEVIGVE
jgi:hypothetical protein